MNERGHYDKPVRDTLIVRSCETCPRTAGLVMNWTALLQKTQQFLCYVGPCGGNDIGDIIFSQALQKLVSA